MLIRRWLETLLVVGDEHYLSTKGATNLFRRKINIEFHRLLTIGLKK